MKTILVTYGSEVHPSINGYNYGSNPPKFVEHQKRLNESASLLGMEVSSWNRNRLMEAGFVDQYNQPTLGDGYFSWKPFIILQTLKENPDDIIINYDSGRNGNFLNAYPHRLVNWCMDNNGMLPGVYIPQYGSNAHWTHRDCFYYMGCDEKKYWTPWQVQITFSIWHGRQCLPFLEEWTEFCSQPRIIADNIENLCGLPNIDGFKEHRHDQSVMTNLCVKHQVRAVFFNCSGHLDKDINLYLAENFH